MPESLSIPDKLNPQHRYPSGPSPVNDTPTLIGLGILLLLAGGLRFYHLDGYGLWSDEFVTLMVVSTKSYADLIKLCFNIPQPIPPIYFVLNKPILDLLGQGETSLRLISTLSSLLTVICVFELGKRLVDVEVGFFAALLCAVSSTQIVYAQNARPYALGLLLSSISMVSFLGWLNNNNKRPHQIIYLASTSLLVYTHYIFAIVPCIQTIHILLHHTPVMFPAPSTRGWLRSWAGLQTCLILLVLPLLPQLWKTIQNRHSLNWERRIPESNDLIMFLNLKAFAWATGIALLVWIGRWVSRTMSRDRSIFHAPWQEFRRWVEPLSFLLSWYLLPLIIFLVLYYYSGLNLFVERYLILCSLPLYLLVPSLAFALVNKSIGRVYLCAYLIVYLLVEPVGLFLQKKEFSQGVPGGNEWRESLEKLQEPDFEAPLLLFQSPFIESNKLNYEGNPILFNYLSAPLHSFYVRRPIPSLVLLPVHWWINDDAHLKFKAKLGRDLDSQETFVLLSTQEFWENFEPWLLNRDKGVHEVHVEKEFRSSGSLGLRRIALGDHPR